MRGLIYRDLKTRLDAALDARLEHGAQRPVALALSGGGDSMALLALAADWAGRRGRRVLAITVDHGLNPDSAKWSALCRSAAQAAGADWVECRWTGDKPETGLPAAARDARHALIADAARRAGARVVLFAHTADDIEEGDWMKARGSTLGALWTWSPSPAWPQGRGLMLCRPLLNERRADLRAVLRGLGRNWIEDPANADVRFGRSRARHDLAQVGRSGLDAPGPVPFHQAGDHVTLDAAAGCFGIVGVARDGSIRRLAASILSASGGSVPPKGNRIAALSARLQRGEDFASTLAGARIVAQGDAVLIGREVGELRRRAVADIALSPDNPAVWDGRFEVTVAAPGWTITAATGRMNRLSDADRTILTRVPAWARGAVPVLIRDDDRAPVLAWRKAAVLALAHRRLGLAMAVSSGETTHECDLDGTTHGETPPSDLFSLQDLNQGGEDDPPRNRKPR